MLKEKDIRPDNLMKLKEPALEYDKKYLKDRINLFGSCNCPACDSDKYSFWAEKDSFTYAICDHCGTIFMNPRATEEILNEFYRQSKNYEFWNKYIFPATDYLRKEKIFKPRAKRIVDLCNKYGVRGGTILEIGSAFGTFCEVIRELDYFDRIIAVEPTPDLAKTCREKGIETIESNVENITIPKKSIDVMVSFEVIEHLHNPFNFVFQATKYLKKGGLFICTCPNGEGLGTLVLKEKAKVVDHEHINYFNPKSIKILLKRNSIDVVEISTPGELDVSLLENYFIENPLLLEDNSFFKYLFLEAGHSVKNNFQEFIRQNNLSSHMWVVGRKI
jgi:2-polyprenyl-3-methyl-5-hydroxy-6-metoxy-1,4-benzoquinol methylase